MLCGKSALRKENVSMTKKSFKEMGFPARQSENVIFRTPGMGHTQKNMRAQLMLVRQPGRQYLD